MNQIIVILLFASIVIQMNCIEFQDCGSKTGEVVSITVSNCPPESDCCHFKIGTNSSIDIKFKSETDSKTATVKVWGIIADIPVPFNLQPSDACFHWGINCPIVKSEDYDLNISMPILKEYPKIRFQVRIALLDTDSNKLLCQQFPAKIE